MPYRRIGQGVFRFGTKAERQTNLDELGALIDWSNADRVLASLYKAVKGEKAWPPLACSRRAEHQSFCAKVIAISRRKGWRRITARCARSARGSGKSSEPGNVPTASDACDGLAFPRQNSRSISRSSLTTANGIGACKPPERTCKAGLQRGSATLACKPPDSKARHDDAISPLNRRFSKRHHPRLPAQ